MIECKCKFCDKHMPLERVEKVTTNYSAITNNYRSVWSCEKCYSSFHYNEDNLEMIVVKTKIREQDYAWVTMLDTKQSAIIKSGQLVEDINCISDITPQNVKAKIKTYLNFL